MAEKPPPPTSPITLP